MTMQTRLLMQHEGVSSSGAPAPFPVPKTFGQDMAKVQKKLFILVVDDEPMLLRTWARIVTWAGHSCQQAANGKEALERYSAAKPDLVLSDYHMAGMTGLELFRELKKTNPDVKMILLSGLITQEEVETCLAEGVKMVLFKPVETEVLIAAIERFGF